MTATIDDLIRWDEPVPADMAEEHSPGPVRHYTQQELAHAGYPVGS